MIKIKQSLNQDVKDYIKANGLYQYQIADEMGITEAAFSVMLRKKLSTNERERIAISIQNIKSGSSKEI